jgi:hypothetical protein
MESIGNKCYIQVYECNDLFSIFNLIVFEKERLDYDHDILVYDHEISVDYEEGELIFYLDLYFTSKQDKDLDGQEDVIFNF